VEAAFGLLSGSMALVADAGHNLSDVLSLLIAWGAAYMATRPANSRYTYGYKSSSILAALANAGLLLVALGATLIETVHRLVDPGAVRRRRPPDRACAAVHERAHGRPDQPRRVAAPGGGRARLGRRRGGRRAHPVRRRALDRPGHEPGGRRRDRLGHLGGAQG